MVSEAISSTTRPETEVGPRPIKAGLGDQESGVSGGRRGVKNGSIWSSKRGLLAVSDCPTFSDFGGADSENVSENRNDFYGIDSSEVEDASPSTTSIAHSHVSLKSLIESCNILSSTKHVLC